MLEAASSCSYNRSLPCQGETGHLTRKGLDLVVCGFELLGLTHSPNERNTMITAQSIFDKVVNGLRAQGSKCLNNSGDCAYRNKVMPDGRAAPDSLKCAAGLLIEDSEYTFKMESISIVRLLGSISYDIVPISMHARLKPHAPLIASLQRVHDISDVNEWEKEWMWVAETHNLQYKPVL